MNKIVLKKIKELLKDTMKDAGFKVNGQRYTRVINDQLFQYIEFQGSLGGYQFTVNVGIDCLFEREILNRKCTFETMRLGMMMGQGDTWWPYTEDAAIEVAELIKNYLLPTLDDCSTYRRVYEIIEPHINDIPNTEKGIMDFALDLYLTKQFLPMVKLCIKLNENDKALFCIEKCIKETKDWLEDYIAHSDKMIVETHSKKYREEFIQSRADVIFKSETLLREYSDLQNEISQNDCSRILKIMEETEIRNLANLKK